jgi:hypothetical protein
MTTAEATSGKIFLNFAWSGPNADCSQSIRVVDLVFDGTKEKISVNLPENINSIIAEKFPFTCRSYHDAVDFGGRKLKPLAEETHSNLLHVTIEQIHNLTVKAGFFERGKPRGPKIMDSSTGKITQQQTVRRSDVNVRLEIPEELKSDQTYSLVISSDNNLSLSARFVKEEVSSLESASSNLDRLGVEELQSLFGQVYIKDKRFEIQRMQAALAGDQQKMNRIIEDELANSQLLMNLANALQRKGVEPQTPQSESFQLESKESEKFHAKALKSLEDPCKTQ